MALDKKEYKKVLRQFIRDYKRLVTCKVCHISDPDKLEFHHRQPELKIWKISDMVSMGKPLKEVMVEVNKCDVLCIDDHEVADRVLLEKYNYKMPINPNKQPQRRAGKYKGKKDKKQ
jgi:hypothetical protein